MSVDLSGLLLIQKDYLYDLRAIASNELPVGNYIQDLQTSLGTLYKDYSSANISSQNVLDNQAEIDTIVQTEQQRLLAKKQEMDNHIYSQNRLVELNTSYRKKQEAYLYIIFMTILAVISIIFCVKLRQVIPYPLIAEVLLIFVVSFFTIYIVSLLLNIYRRDKMNFDNIVYSKPFDASGVKIDISSTDLTTSSRNIFCMGQDCCTGNTVWNPNVLKCDISCPRPDQPENKLNQNGSCVKECSGTYTEDASGKFCNIVQGFTNRPSSMANPYYSSEYDEYGRY